MYIDSNGNDADSIFSNWDNVDWKELLRLLGILMVQLFIASVKYQFENIFKSKKNDKEHKDQVDIKLDQNASQTSASESEDIAEAYIVWCYPTGNSTPAALGPVVSIRDANLKGAFGGKIDERNKTAEQYLISDDLW